jgi:hypothetical protein
MPTAPQKKRDQQQQHKARLINTKAAQGADASAAASSKHISNAQVLYAQTFGLHEEEAAEAFYKSDGFVILRDVMSMEHRTRFVKEYVKEVLEKQPWNIAHPFEVFDPITKQKLDVEADTERYLQSLFRGHLSSNTLKAWAEAGPFHRGFGACCDPKVFHQPEVWELRQNPTLYNAASRILGDKALWVDINRTTFKLPGEGEDEWLHWDEPFLKKDWEAPTSLSGKVAVTDTVFYAVPGTHTREAHDAIVAEYAQHYPHASAQDPKFKLSPEKPDPLDLFGRCRAIFVPAGACIFWSGKLLHGVAKLKRTAPIQMSIYLGFMPAVDRPEYKAIAGISELEDRCQSFYKGCAPTLWPSLDRIHYYPERFRNFHNCLVPYVRKTNPGWPGLTTRTLKNDLTRTVWHFVPVLDPNYVPYAGLTLLGKRLLGLEPWP